MSPTTGIRDLNQQDTVDQKNKSNKVTKDGIVFNII